MDNPETETWSWIPVPLFTDVLEDSTHVLGDAIIRQEILVVEAAELEALIQVTEGDHILAAPLHHHRSAGRVI